MSPTPEGLLVGRPSRPWTIGRRLGSGACGTVHELVPPPAGSSKKSPPAPGAGYAIKLAPLPPPRASTKAGKKRKKTAEERNADLIKYEYLTLQNVGAELRGRVVPDIPFMGDPPAFGETADKKFRYLVMERMAAPLSEVVPLLLASHGNKARGGAAASVPLGDVAAAMLDCLRALHERGLLFVDVKPENFMLSGAAPAAKSGRKKASSSSTDVAKRVRLIDFGLVEPWNDVVQGGRREDEGGALVGTPAYASLHVSSGHTAALRDDLEALGYVVAELALTMLSSSGKKGGASGGKRKKKDDDDGVLPWSHAKSEDELYNIKRDEMDEGKRSESKLFAGLKAAGADAVMGDYFAAVRGLKYSETPDYDSLRSCLKELAVTVDGKGVSAGARAASGAAPKKKSAAKSPARRRSARRKQEDSDSEDDDVVVVDENVENGTARGKRPNVSVGMARAARPTRNARKAKKETREMGTQTTPEVIDLNSSDDDDDADTMDWEAVASDENAAPDDGGGARGRGVLKLVVVEGPHQGQEISFGGDLPDTVLVGRDPASRAAAKDAARFALPADGSASAVHAKFVVGSKTKVRSVRVHDMSSANGTYVQGSGLPKGKSRQAFANDKIRVGESLLQIRKA